MDRFLKTAVRNFHLLIAESFFEKSVSPATADPQACIVDLELEIVGADAGQINLYDPAIVTPVNVGSRVPQPARWSDTMGDS